MDFNAHKKTWLKVAADSDFSIYNLPFGIFSTKSDARPRVGVRIGDFVIDLAKLQARDFFSAKEITTAVLINPFLNDFISLGKTITTQLRNELFDALTNAAGEAIFSGVLYQASEVEMHLPVQIGDYTDFYSSYEHAMNVGKMLRPDNPLMPNWKHLPVGYHGRSSSIVLSGTDFYRPKGQMLPAGAENPVFGASKLMDFELEMAFVIGKNNALGDAISTKDAEEYIFGFMLFNDWSARDIQGWEYQPLGPFLGKNFASSISAWIVPIEALEPFRTESPKQDPEVLPYLKYDGNHTFDIALEVLIQPENSVESRVCLSNFKFLYWNICQQVAHHTINGCNLRVGDMLASGTISGSTPDSAGSMLELTWRGTKPLTLADGTERKFLNDNDSVIMRGYCQKGEIRVGFGEVIGKVLPAKA